MTYMLCRNRVEDFDQWKAVFSSHQNAHRDAGFRLVQVWRTADEPNNIFFLFEIASREKAQAFIDDPEAARAAEAAGVVDGEFLFLEDIGGY